MDFDITSCLEKKTNVQHHEISLAMLFIPHFFCSGTKLSTLPEVFIVKHADINTHKDTQCFALHQKNTQEVVQVKCYLFA